MYMYIQEQGFAGHWSQETVLWTLPLPKYVELPFSSCFDTNGVLYYMGNPNSPISPDNPDSPDSPDSPDNPIANLRVN